MLVSKDFGVYDRTQLIAHALNLTPFKFSKLPATDVHTAFPDLTMQGQDLAGKIAPEDDKILRGLRCCAWTV